MDFKVCGSRGGVTAIQLDVKLAGGVPLHVIEEALDQAYEGRSEILDTMEAALLPQTAFHATSASALAGGGGSSISGGGGGDDVRPTGNLNSRHRKSSRRRGRHDGGAGGHADSFRRFLQHELVDFEDIPSRTGLDASSTPSGPRVSSK